MLRSRVCEAIGIRYPIFQGGMAWVSDGKLAAAVSNTGGLGIISAMNADENYVREQIRLCRAMTDKPFGVNIMLMNPHVQAVAKLVAEEKVPVVTTGAGLPGKYMPDWIEAGIKVVPVVPSVAIARRVERGGATAVIAEGTESGGHVCEMTTMALVPQVVAGVGPDVPVVAAGGIASGDQFIAAMKDGATEEDLEAIAAEKAEKSRRDNEARQKADEEKKAAEKEKKNDNPDMEVPF